MLGDLSVRERVDRAVKAHGRVKAKRVRGLGDYVEDLGAQAGAGLRMCLESEDHRANGSDRVVDVAHGPMDAFLGFGGGASCGCFECKTNREEALNHRVM